MKYHKCRSFDDSFHARSIDGRESRRVFHRKLAPVLTQKWKSGQKMVRTVRTSSTLEHKRAR